jgi:hypothetical protein
MKPLLRNGRLSIRLLHNVALLVFSRSLPGNGSIRGNKSDLVGVPEVRWAWSGTEPAGEYTFFYGKGNENRELDRGFLYTRESYKQLKG